MRVTINGHALEVEDGGAGLPVLLLHGFPLSSAIFAPVRAVLENAARVITPDLRGFGRSDAPTDGYSMDALADDVLALADELELERFVLGGHSMGGYLAFRVAARQPERLAGLVLIDTRAGADTVATAEHRRGTIAELRAGGREAFLDGFLPALVAPSPSAHRTKALEQLRAIAAPIPDHVLIGCLEGMMARPDSSELLVGLDVPALVVVGAEDAVTPPDEARSMVRSLPQARLTLIDEAGHTPTLERPVPTADAIAVFLRKVAGSTTEGR